MKGLPQVPPQAPAADAVECRGCGVVCQKVVYPSACLARSCPFLYAHDQFGHTYVGCTHGVFSTEIDLDVLRRAARRRNGFGAVRAMRQPFDICPSGVERAYEDREDPLGCINPEFHELPDEEPSFRVIVNDRRDG
ncbi:MAG: hypothetical protein ACTHNU_14490 [Gaiellales bacterium]